MVMRPFLENVFKMELTDEPRHQLLGMHDYWLAEKKKIIIIINHARSMDLGIAMPVGLTINLVLTGITQLLIFVVLSKMYWS